MISSKSIHTKLAIAFLALMVIPLTATGLYGHFFTRTALSQQALDRSIHQVHLQAESIVSALQQVQGDALHLGSLRNFERFQQQTVAEEREFWRRELEQDFLELASVRPMYHGLLLVDTAGQGILEIKQADVDRLVASPPDAINTQNQPCDQYSESALGYRGASPTPVWRVGGALPDWQHPLYPLCVSLTGWRAGYRPERKLAAAFTTHQTRFRHMGHG